METDYYENSTTTYAIVPGNTLSARVKCETDITMAYSWIQGAVRIRAMEIMTCDAETFYVSSSLRVMHGAEIMADKKWNHAIARDHI